MLIIILSITPMVFQGSERIILWCSFSTGLVGMEEETNPNRLRVLMLSVSCNTGHPGDQTSFYTFYIFRSLNDNRDLDRDDINPERRREAVFKKINPCGSRSVPNWDFCVYRPLVVT